MTAIYAFGSDPKQFYSRSQALVARLDPTTNALVWAALSTAFSGLSSFQSVTRKNADRWLAVSTTGQVAWSSNPSTGWTSYDLETRNLLVTQVSNDGNNFLMVGHEKNPKTLNEVAFVAHSSTGEAGTWARTYPGNLLGSILHDLVLLSHTDGSPWLAVGSKEGGASPFMVVGPRDGPWTEVALPSRLPGPILSVAYHYTNGGIDHSATNQVWIGGTGYVATATWATTPVWSINQTIAIGGVPVGVTRLVVLTINGATVTLALAGSGVWYTANNRDWYWVSQPGYNFSDAAVYHDTVLNSDRIYFGVWGLLNQYTGFVGEFDHSTPSLTLTGFDTGANAIHAQTLIVA